MNSDAWFENKRVWLDNDSHNPMLMSFVSDVLVKYVPVFINVCVSVYILSLCLCIW